MPDLRPIFISEQYKTDTRFTSTKNPPINKSLPQRNVQEHGNRLYGKLQSLLTSQTELISENESLNKGIYLEVSGAQGTALNIESLEDFAYIGVFGQECRSSTGHFCNEIF